jgi:hypothetical protein
MFVKVLYSTCLSNLGFRGGLFYFKKTIDHSQLQAEEGEGFRRGDM